MPVSFHGHRIEGPISGKLAGNPLIGRLVRDHIQSGVPRNRHIELAINAEVVAVGDKRRPCRKEIQKASP